MNVAASSFEPTRQAARGQAATDPIRAEAIRTLYAQMRNTSLAAMVITVYMVAASWSFTSHVTIAGWAAVQIGSICIREQLIRTFARLKPPAPELERWARYYVLHQALSGLVWGATIFLFAHPGQPITVALTLCCLYSIAAGSVPAQSYTPTSLYVIVGVLFGLVLVRLVATGDFDYIVLGVASSLFALTMVAFCRIQARTVSEGFRIRFENDALVEALSTQKLEAESARHKAELASLAKSQFLAAASHDLRQPLYALSLFSASLGELKLDADGRGVVTRIQDSIAVMESLFEGLLDISRLEAGVVKAKIIAVSIDAVFDRLSQLYHPIAVDRRLDLRFRSDGEWVRSDPVLLEQVLSNLVSNAMRNTRSGGVLVSARVRGASVRLEVWDTGRGIGRRDLERIFEEFVQVDNPQRDRRKGLGLGLSIAQRAAALIGGTIEVSSREGRGSRFGLAQPKAEPVPKPVSPLPSIVSGSQSRAALPVMVVEDDQDVRLALGDILTRWGVQFEMFADAEAALGRVAEGARYGLVLADYRLPGALNGLELASEIKRRHVAPPPEIVLITGDFDAGLISASHARGFALLHKPLRPEVLRNLLHIDADAG